MSDRRPRSPTLTELRALHRRFEEDRGFDFRQRLGRPDSDRLEGDEWLHYVEYATLALVGEAGELANAVKKARREHWLGRDHAAQVDRVREEAADVLAYLLKLTDALELDLVETYLEKMNDNCVRFPPGGRSGGGACVVTIAGPPGSGKSTLAQALREHFNTYLERWEENEHLPALWDAGAGEFDAHANEVWFLDRVAAFLESAPRDQTLVLDQDPIATVRVYGRLFRDTGRLSIDEYHDLLWRLMQLESEIVGWPGGRVIVLLDAQPETLLERLASRRGGSGPDPGFVRDVRDRFHALGAQIQPRLALSSDDASVDELAQQVLSVVHAEAPDA